MLQLNTNFYYLNRLEDGQTTGVGTWIDTINNPTSSNFTITRDNFNKISKEGTANKSLITGNGALNTFRVTHQRNNKAVNVKTIDENTGSEMFPEIKVLNENTVQLTFLNPVQTGQKISVSIV